MILDVYANVHNNFWSFGKKFCNFEKNLFTGKISKHKEKNGFRDLRLYPVGLGIILGKNFRIFSLCKLFKLALFDNFQIFGKKFSEIFNFFWRFALILQKDPTFFLWLNFCWFLALHFFLIY
jgi:hypothetical protein